MGQYQKRAAAREYTTDCAICLARHVGNVDDGHGRANHTLGSDVQARRPSTYVSLSRVGVTGVEKVIRIRVNGEAEQLFYAELECFVDLGPEQKGAHMSRFEEVVNEAIDEVILGEAFKAETLAAHIAERVRDRQEARRAEVTIAAHYPERKQAPASGSTTQEIYRLYGSAVASARGMRRLVGVEAQGADGVPMRAGARHGSLTGAARGPGLHRGRDRARVQGRTVATHNQRGIGTLHVGCPEGCEDAIRRRPCSRSSKASMSSEITS